MIPEYYEFQSLAKVLSGQHAVENIPSELRHLGGHRPFILSDQMLEYLGILAIVEEGLRLGGMEAGAVFTDIPADSSMEVVRRAKQACELANCDCIVAVGGGSVIDTAKGMRLLLSQQAEDLSMIMGCENTGLGVFVPFVAVPTTSGTGSETTLVAVIRDEARKMKMEFVSYYLQPDVAVLDPRMTSTLPPRITASTGMDALCHAIEAYTCLQKNPLSDAYAAAAITAIGEHLVGAVKDGRRKKARLAMANASFMAGASFSNSMVGIVHAIGHALGGVCHVPHGEAMSILLPICMEYNLKKKPEICGPLYGELLLYLAGPERYARTPKARRAAKAIDAVSLMARRLHRICGLPLTLKECGVNPRDFQRVARTAIDDGAMIVNPAHAEVKDVMAILKRAYQ